MPNITAGYRRIFWGLLLLTFHINLGNIQILPDFLSLLIILSGITSLYSAYPSPFWYKAATFAICQSMLALSSFIVSIAVPNQPSWLSVLLNTVGAIFSLLVFFYILEGSVQMLRNAAMPVKAEILEKRVGFYLILTCTAFVCFIASTLWANPMVMFAALGVSFIQRLWLIVTINRLKKGNIALPLRYLF